MIAWVTVAKNSPMTCRWYRTYRHRGQECALVSWDENWYVWWEYPFGAKGNGTPASGWSGSTLYTVCLGCWIQISEEGHDTEEMQAGTQKDQRVPSFLTRKYLYKPWLYHIQSYAFLFLFFVFLKFKVNYTIINNSNSIGRFTMKWHPAILASLCPKSSLLFLVYIFSDMFYAYRHAVPYVAFSFNTSWRLTHINIYLSIYIDR